MLKPLRIGILGCGKIAQVRINQKGERNSLSFLVYMVDYLPIIISEMVSSLINLHTDFHFNLCVICVFSF